MNSGNFVVEFNENDAECIATDSFLDTSVWLCDGLMYIIVRGVIIPLRIEQFNKFIELLSNAYIYVNSKKSDKEQKGGNDGIQKQ